jgi:Ca-activated chloride channel family protein
MAAVLVFSGSARAGQVRLNLATSAGVVRADRPERVYLKVGLDGLAIDDAAARTPINVAIVLDKSGSMTGQKIRKAKEAAKMAVDRLGPEDIVSVIAYDHSVKVLVPATKASEKAAVKRRIDRLYASGNTALFAGVSKGAREVRKFIDSRRVSRIVLLSDGQANVGPSSPYELADLGASLIKEGISVTTIGLGMGYNEDLMAALAEASDGNHAFARNAGDLARIFNYEFGDLLSVVARDIRIEVNFSKGARPVRVLGRKAKIYGNQVVARINQVYAAQEKFLMIEVDLPPGVDGSFRDIATATISYNDSATSRKETLSGLANVRFSSSEAAVRASENQAVLVATIELQANENNRLAVTLKDRGETKKAAKVLDDNVRFLENKSAVLKSKRLKKLAADNQKDKESLSAPAPKWRAQRKSMRDRQSAIDLQRGW